MTKAELIAELECFDDEDIVMFSYESNDYWRTVLATEVENIEEGWVKHSDYHRTNQVVDESEYEDPEEVGEIPENKLVRKVILIKG